MKTANAEGEMIQMTHPYLTSQLAADRQAARLADASRQRLARQAIAARKAAAPDSPVRQPARQPRLRLWLRHRLAA
jgi:hypothetical protein